jgi:hypothetical protein
MGIFGLLMIFGPLLYLVRYFKPIEFFSIRVLATVTTFILYLAGWMLLNYSISEFLEFETDYGILILLLEIFKIIVVTFAVSRISSAGFFSVYMRSNSEQNKS